MSYQKSMPSEPQQTEAQLPLRKCLYFLLLLSLPLQAANTLQQQIEQQVRQDVMTFARQLGASGSLKPKINLSLPAGLRDKGPCQHLQLSRNNASQPPWGRTSYSLNCQDKVRWQSRVTARVQLALPVVVARVAIAKGETLTASMLDTRLTELKQNKLGFVLDPASIIGLKTARRVNAGQLLSQHLLTQQLLVEKGAQVLIRAEKSGFAASTKGLALEDGRLGQRIKVRNLSSGAELEVEVVAEATVQTFF